MDQELSNLCLYCRCEHGAQVSPKARAAPHVLKANLGLLLRLVRTALQASGAMSSSGYRPAAVDINNQRAARCGFSGTQNCGIQSLSPNMLIW